METAIDEEKDKVRTQMTRKTQHSNKVETDSGR